MVMLMGRYLGGGVACRSACTIAWFSLHLPAFCWIHLPSYKARLNGRAPLYPPH